MIQPATPTPSHGGGGTKTKKVHITYFNRGTLQLVLMSQSVTVDAAASNSGASMFTTSTNFYSRTI